MSREAVHYFTPLDTLRLFLVLAVCAEHWLHTNKVVSALQLGSIGVDFFFVLSGFLITRILLGYRDQGEQFQRSKGQGLKVFFMRRVLRIFPLYYAVVIITTLGNSGIIDDALPWNLTYTTNFLTEIEGQWLGNFGHFWSLAVEEQFYLVWPFFVLFLPRKFLFSFFAAVAIIAVGSRMWFASESLWDISIIVNTLSSLDTLAIGAILGWLSLYRLHVVERLAKQHWLLMIAVVLLVLAHWRTTELSINYWQIIFIRTTHAFCAAVIIAKLSYGHLGAFKTFWVWKPLVFCGQISYGMYLFHNFVPGFLLGVPLPDSEWIRFAVYLVALVGVSWIANLLIEKPFLRLKGRFTMS